MDSNNNNKNNKHTTQIRTKNQINFQNYEINENENDKCKFGMKW